jgi:Tol biopolymer transport system component
MSPLTPIGRWTVPAVMVVALACAGSEGQVRGGSPTEGLRPWSAASGGARRVVQDGFGASFSPGGDQIAYSRMPENTGIAVLDLRSGGKRDLTTVGKAPVWSPDGRSIAYVRGASETALDAEEVWLVGADGSGAPRLLLAQAGAPAWVQGGRALVVQSRKESRLLEVAVAGNRAPELFHDGLTSSHPAVSADGGRLAFSRDERLEIVDRQTKQGALGWATPGVTRLRAAWSPDGKRLAFGGNSLAPIGLWILDVDGRRAVQIAVGNHMRPAWSADGQSLAFDVQQFGRRSIWMLDRSVVERCLARAAIAESQLGFGAGLCPEAIKTPAESSARNP